MITLDHIKKLQNRIAKLKTYLYIDKKKIIHESLGTFFKLDGAIKEFTIALGLKWEGGETFDDLVS